MKMKKLFAGLVATSMIAAGTSAFAAVNEYALNPTVDEKTGVAKISEADVAKLDDYANTQMTVLIIPEAAYNKLTDDDDETNITDDDIYYIDQMAANDTNLFQKMGLKCGADLIPEGETSATYYVRVGGAYDINDGIYEGSFTVTKTAAGTKITVKWGDITGDDAVNSSDAIAALMNFAGYSETYNVKGYDTVVGEKLGDYKWGDITGDDAVNSSDAIAALMNFAGYSESYTVKGVAVEVGSAVEIEIK